MDTDVEDIIRHVAENQLLYILQSVRRAVQGVYLCKIAMYVIVTGSEMITETIKGGKENI